VVVVVLVIVLVITVVIIALSGQNCSDYRPGYGYEFLSSL